MMRTMKWCVGIVFTVIGCRASGEASVGSSTPPTPPPPERDTRPAPIRSDAQILADLANDVQTAPDAIAEGAAIKRLQKWMADHGHTFQLDTTRAESGTPMREPSAFNDVMRAHVTVFRGQQPIYEFTFVPRDNRNLALLGQ
jgi:hypothetical protein